MHHEPVLLREVLELLAPKPGERICDVTLGLGGHAAALIAPAQPGGFLIGIDADKKNLDEATKRMQPPKTSTRYIHANFRELPEVVDAPVDVLFADLGVSSPHFDDPERGFSFRSDGPLDLRFDQTSGQSASDWIASADTDHIARLLREWGELRGAGKLASIIVERRPRTTTQLQECVEAAFGWRAKSVMAQVFQAFRIFINDEMGALQSLLAAGPRLLRPGGRFAVIAYHSLEDRLVKQAFKALTLVEKDPQTGQDRGRARFQLLTKKAIVPGEDEVARNARARSAKLRAIIKPS